MSTVRLNGSFPRSCQVLIIGAGPAGMASALAQSGQKELILVDARPAAWRKPCDGILTPQSLRQLTQCGADVCGQLLLQPARHIRVLDRDNHKEALIPLTGHFMVDRLEFDSFLRRKVAALPNTLLCERTRALDWQIIRGRVRLRLLREGSAIEILADHIVDATGAFGLARRFLSSPLPSAVAVQLWFPVQSEPERCDWVFDQSVTPHYAWAIQKPTGLVLGGIFPSVWARRAVRIIRESLVQLLGVEGEPWRTQVATITLPGSARDVCLELGPFLAVGEAAGLINAGTGEGISFALRSGYACGAALAFADLNRQEVAARYLESAVQLVHEADIQARHAALLFDVNRRGQLEPDEWLVPIQRRQCALLVR